MRRAALTAVVFASLAATTGAASPLASDVSAPKACKAGTLPAVIGGKRVCLKAGAACKRTRDAQYHRYGFHCHGKRLTRATGRRPRGPLHAR